MDFSIVIHPSVDTSFMICAMFNTVKDLVGRNQKFMAVHHSVKVRLLSGPPPHLILSVFIIHSFLLSSRAGCCPLEKCWGKMRSAGVFFFLDSSLWILHLPYDLTMAK